MIDFRINDEFYCVQMNVGKFGWTRVNEETGFSSIPDSGYLIWNEFKTQFDKIVK